MPVIDGAEFRTGFGLVETLSKVFEKAGGSGESYSYGKEESLGDPEGVSRDRAVGEYLKLIEELSGSDRSVLEDAKRLPLVRGEHLGSAAAGIAEATQKFQVALLVPIWATHPVGES